VPERGAFGYISAVAELPRAILFDLDDTLLRAYVNPERAWAAVIEAHSPLLGPLTPGAAAQAIQRYAREFWSDPERHRFWRQRLYESRREIVRRALPELSLDVARQLADRFSALRDEEMHLYPGAHETLDALRARGVRLGCITNGESQSQRRKLERFELAHRFEHIQIESEQGFGKPEERAYRHALECLAVTAAELWIVGDNLEWEVAAPQRLGIHAIWYDGEGQGLPAGSEVRPDRTIRRLGELVPAE
jgi:putative hydrolase of the HAD superfamily